MKKHNRASCFLLLIILCAILLIGCNNPATETTYTVRFTVNGQTAGEQTVKSGAFPAQVDIPQGALLRAWLDDAGNAVDPFATAVSRDVTYTAQLYPALTEHVPYLFSDTSGCLRPDEALTSDALQAALQALATPEAETFFPALPTGAQTVNIQTLQTILTHFFSANAVQTVFSGAADTPVTRTAFAFGMNTLLGRDTAEKTALAENSALPKDLTWDRKDIVSLLEASVSHNPDQNGKFWTQQQIPTAYAPGFLNIDGWLYYIDENGCYLRNSDYGALHFGPDGRYTCGDTELDAIVAPILAEIQKSAPEAGRMDWLRSAYEYSRDSFDYLRRNAYETGDTGWEIEDAKKMFTSGRGNCYSYAAAFWALARGLGYEARAISGTCLKDYQPHGWVFIEIDGEDYLFDPEWEMVYREQREDFTKDMFMLTMDEIGWWSYRW